MFLVSLLRFRTLAVLLLFLSFAVRSETAQLLVPPDVLIKTITEEVIVLMRQESHAREGNSGRAAVLVEEKVAPHLDFEQMTMLAMGPNWRVATSQERSRLVREFHMLLVRTYGALLDGYRDQAIVFLPLRAAPTDTDVTVRAQIRQSSGDAIVIAIRMKKLPEGWKAYDIVVDGVSLVLTYRGTFREEIARTGVSGLIKVLAEKNK